jgi:hypothetical protein
MDEFFGAPSDPGGSADAPPAPEAAPEAQAAESAPELPPPASPVAQPVPGAPELPEGAAVDGKQIRIDVPRFNNIYRDYKYAQEVRQFAPTIEEAQAQYQRASDMRHMHADFSSADPGAVDEFLKYWESQSPEGFAVMTQRALDKAPAAVREQMSQTVMAGRADALYAKAAETQDANDLYKARMFEWSNTGRYRTDPLQRPDPLAARERDIANREQRLQQGEQQRAEAAWNNWQTATNQAIGTGLVGAIDKMLDPLKGRFADAPALFNALRNQIRAEVVHKVEGNEDWVKNYNLDYRTARKTMSPGDRQALVGTYLAKAQQAVAATAAPLVNQATKLLVTQNQEAHQRLANGSAKRGTAAPGQPVRQSIAPRGDRQAMTLDQMIDADMG